MPKSSRPIEYTPPDPDEIEISIFGPNVGECIVAHLGSGKWMIVDSCFAPETSKPIALDYLSKLGLDPSKVVSLIVITHWHDDHIKGVCGTIDACELAKICIPQALARKEFLTLMSAYSDEDSVLGKKEPGTKEMNKVFTNIIKNGRNITWASVDTTIFNESSCLVYCLSPSNKDFQNSLSIINSLIPRDDTYRTAVPRLEKNDNAVALWIKSEGRHILLGSDLETTKDPLTGWEAALNSVAWEGEKAQVFKIPHHGSETGHSDKVWEKMIVADPHSLLTTNNRGGYKLPQEKDIDRIKKYCSELYCTTIPRSKPPKRNSTVERTIREMAIRRTQLGKVMGHIQMRITKDGEKRVNLKEPASRL